MKREAVAQNLLAIIILIAFGYMTWNAITTQPIQIDPQQLLIGQLIAYGIAGTLALVGFFFMVREERRNREKWKGEKQQ